MTYKNNILIDTLYHHSTPRYPVWVMRQAGRVLREYREVRQQAGSFIHLVKNPELAAEVTIQPVDILGVDAAIIFSDILVIPEAMGFPYTMEEAKGPIFPRTIKTMKDVEDLQVTDVEQSLKYVLDAIKITKKELNNRVPLIGFAGAPLTIFTYLVEGKGSKTFSEARKMLYTQPQLSHLALQKITTITIHYLKAQIQAGADLVQLFDSWAGTFAPDQYAEFGTAYIRQICDAITEVPVTVFAKGAWFALEDLKETSCTTIGLDWNMNIAKTRAIVGENKVLQGNLDPCVLYGTFHDIKKATIKMLDDFAGKKHIANLGHGVYPDTPADNLKCFIDTVKEYNKR